MSKPSDVVGWLGAGENYTVIDWRARAEQAEAELARLTTPRSEDRVGGDPVLVWRRGKPFCIARTVLPEEEWTPLPKPKEAE